MCSQGFTHCWHHPEDQVAYNKLPFLEPKTVINFGNDVTKLNLIKGISYKNLIFMTINQDINPYHLNSVHFPRKPYGLLVMFALGGYLG